MTLKSLVALQPNSWCLRKGRCSTDDLFELLSLLPSEAQARSARHVLISDLFYCHGPTSGLRNAVLFDPLDALRPATGKQSRKARH